MARIGRGFPARVIIRTASFMPRGYTASVSGGVTFGGTAAHTLAKIGAVAGGATFAGTAAHSWTKVATQATGGITLGGAAIANPFHLYTYSASGGIVFAGTAPRSWGHRAPVGGGIVFGGTGALESIAYALQADPALNGTWTLDLTSTGQSSPGVAATRGRDLIRGLAPAKAGTLTAKLLNQAGAYSPGGSGGLARNVPVRLMANDGVINRYLFSGLLERPVQERPDQVSYTNLTAYGPLSRLAGKKLSTGLYQNITTDVAIGYLLDAAGWSAYSRALDTGKTTLLWWWLDDEDAMAALNALVNTEGPGAAIYERGDGAIVFKSRHARITESRSVASQATFNGTGGSAAPHIRRPFTYDDGIKDVVNSCTIQVANRVTGDPASVVWSLGSDVSMGASEVRKYQAVGSNRDPFMDAITPVSGTDYTIVTGSVTPTLDRNSGGTVTVTLTAGASGATLTGLQLRATPTTSTVTQISNTVDASASQAANGVQSYALEVRPDIDVNVAQDFTNAVVGWWKNGRPSVSVTVVALASAEERRQALRREVGDRITVIEPHTNVSADFYVEEIDHALQAPSHMVTTLRGQQAEAATYFIVGTSTIGGADVLGW